MEVSTERKAYYDRLFEKGKPIENELGGTETYSVPYKSNTEYTKFHVYEIPIGENFKTGLRFNLYNSRILAHKLKKAQKDGKQLDLEDSNTQEFLESVLLENESYSKHATEELKKELQTTGQREPAIISCDGVIWNANRRIAIRKQLFKETGDPKWSRVKVIRLPELSMKELKLLEHRLQMRKSFKEDYGSITLRLRCRQAIKDEKWDYRELSNSFADYYSKKKIDDFIDEIDLIDEYLIRTDHKDDYPLIESKGKGKGVEIFTALNRHINWEKNKAGRSDEEIDKIKTIFFAIIHHPKTTFEDTRDLVKQLQKPKTREVYLENSPIYKNFVEYTVPDTKNTEKAFSSEIMKQELDNKKETQAMYEATENTPIEVANDALIRLDTIKEDSIEKGDKEFIEKLNEIEKKITYLKKLTD